MEPTLADEREKVSLPQVTKTEGGLQDTEIQQDGLASEAADESSADPPITVQDTEMQQDVLASEAAGKSSADPPLTAQEQILAYWKNDLSYGNVHPPLGISEAERKRWNDILLDRTPVDYLHEHLVPNLEDWMDRFIGYIPSSRYVGTRTDYWNLLDDDLQAQLLAWAPSAPKLLNSKATFYVFIKAWCWRLLYDNLFSPECSEKWCGEFWAAYGKVFATLKASCTGNSDDHFARSFHAWGHLSAKMLYMKHGYHTSADYLRDKIIQGFGPMIDVLIPDFDYYIGALVRTAIRLDFAIQSHRAHFEFVIHDPDTKKLHGFPVSPKSPFWEVYHTPEGASEHMHLFDSTLERAAEGDDTHAPKSQAAGLIMKPMLRHFGRMLAAFGEPGATCLSDMISFVDYEKEEVDDPMKIWVEETHQEDVERVADADGSPSEP
ncbi:hypothetical protein HJFPF1_06062 [Paramyrothecium foliicola]|nr:hypothetical protein HJFPF1_06062 [Paramyrothecium foliicola]